MLEAITLSIVTALDGATIMHNYHSQYNCTRAELAGKRCALDSPIRQSMRAQRLNATRRLGIESPEAGYNTCKCVSVEHTHIIKP